MEKPLYTAFFFVFFCSKKWHKSLVVSKLFQKERNAKGFLMFINQLFRICCELGHDFRRLKNKCNFVEIREILKRRVFLAKFIEKKSKKRVFEKRFRYGKTAHMIGKSFFCCFLRNPKTTSVFWCFYFSINHHFWPLGTLPSCVKSEKRVFFASSKFYKIGAEFLSRIWFFKIYKNL